MRIEGFFGKDRYTADELRLIIEAIPANVFYKDTRCRYQLASHVCRMLNGENEDYTIIGKTDLEIQVEEALGRQYYEEDCALIANGGAKKYISEMHFGEGTYYFEISKQAMYDSDGNISGVVGMVTDMTELITLQKELETLSEKDSLTGSYNRTFLESRKANGVDETDLPFSVIISDCNGLKQVNDSYGHNVGDEYICEIAKIIGACVPQRSEVIRLGGDEFLALIPNCTERECGSLIKRIQIEDSEHRVRGIPLSSSFGGATITSPEQSLSDAIAQADACMYEEKKMRERRAGMTLDIQD